MDLSDLDSRWRSHLAEKSNREEKENVRRWEAPMGSDAPKSQFPSRSHHTTKSIFRDTNSGTWRVGNEKKSKEVIFIEDAVSFLHKHREANTGRKELEGANLWNNCLTMNYTGLNSDDVKWIVKELKKLEGPSNRDQRPRGNSQRRSRILSIPILTQLSQETMNRTILRRKWT